MVRTSKTKAQLATQIHAWHDVVDLCKDAFVPVFHVKRVHFERDFKKKLPVHTRPVKFCADPPACLVAPQPDPVFFVTESMHLLGLECGSNFL